MSRYRRRHPDREEDRRKEWEFREWALVLAGVAVAALLAIAIILTTVSTTVNITPSPKVQSQWIATLRSEQNAWNQIAAGNKRLAKCYNADLPCIHP